MLYCWWGPAGAMLGLLLARQNIPVMLLESHMDFDRDFRGDTVFPSVLDVVYELGLIEKLMKIPHTKISKLSMQTPKGGNLSSRLFAPAGSLSACDDSASA